MDDEQIWPVLGLMGKFFFTVLLAVAELERGFASERTKEVNAYRKKMGLPHSRNSPIGWKIVGKRAAENENKRSTRRFIVDFEERTKTYEGEPVLSRKTGKPRIEWVFTLQTGESDGADDDGIRKVALDEWGREEFKAAVKRSGSRAEAGGTLVLAIVENRDKPTDSAQQHLRAKYTPSLGIPDDDF
jgi:hypothetical protein